MSEPKIERHHSCPSDNEGNLVTVHCDSPCVEPPKHYIFHEKEPKEECCCFDVYMTKAWVTSKGGDKDHKTEFMITGYANDQSGVFPGMGLYAALNSNWGWCNINTKVGSFCLTKGQKQQIYIRLDYIEVDIAAAGAWELGSDNGAEDDNLDGPVTTITLDCEQPALTRTRIAAWAHKAKGGAKNTRIAVEFTAFPRKGCCQ